jgi:hypothetical protein
MHLISNVLSHYAGRKTCSVFLKQTQRCPKELHDGRERDPSVVETIKEYRTMLVGCLAIHVYTDHRNLTFNTFQTQGVLRWHLFLLKAARTSLLMHLVACPFLREDIRPRFFQKCPPTSHGNPPIESILSFPWSQMRTNSWIVSYLCLTSRMCRFRWIFRQLRKHNYRSLCCSSKPK